MAAVDSHDPSEHFTKLDEYQVTMASMLVVLIETMGRELKPKELASLALVNHELHRLVTPNLYHTLRFHSSGQITSRDRLLLMLDIMSDSSFDKTKFTRIVMVTGSWYQTYDAIDSDLGPQGVLSPAARMLSALVACCVDKMQYLKEFIWDLQVSITERLVSSVIARPHLERLQLRLGTNSTPKPYFHPVLGFDRHINVQSLNLVQIDNHAVLESFADAPLFASKLKELTLWADADSELSVEPLLSRWRDQRQRFPLTALDFRGFSDLGWSPASVWNCICSSTLKDLTLEIGPSFQVSDCNEFWSSAMEAGLRPSRLSTNLLASGLIEFISSFSGLEALSIMTCDPNRPVEPLGPLLNFLQRQHSNTLKVLGICPQEHEDYLLDAQMVSEHILACHKIEELRFGPRQPDITPILMVLEHLNRLRSLQIVGQMGLAQNQEYVQNVISYALEHGIGNNLIYVAFDDGPVYMINRTMSIVWLKVKNTVGYIEDSVLLHEKLFSWVSRGT
ncbi:hypothetical protein DTO166G4_4738 [Paecilomyces variotii]|nr:hypothetical protein DTO166G4_4738 [Paecilomyces variotii]KAJ9239332.1 hypothetical protein DTO166G5_2501 [Paecilomyces variotii]KAJ9259845.1 hypothetical protein DTO195F2_4722 [Paecilomyces variotii]